MSRVTYINYKDIPSLEGPSIHKRIEAGDILIIQDAPEVHWLSRLLKIYEQQYFEGDGQSVLDLVEHKSAPTIQNITLLRDFVRRIRSTHTLPGLFSSFAKIARFPNPVVLDVGLCRLVFPDNILSQIQERQDIFPPEDFHSPRNGALEEVFYARKEYGQPHRELDLPHSAMQTHLWFPLHDIAEDESLLIFPEAYRQDIVVDLAKKEQPPETWGLGHPLKLALKKGDMIMFHSEHVHASPYRRGKAFRFSYDFRIVNDCLHDHGWHHQEFWNVGNFTRNQEALNTAANEFELFNSEEKDIDPFRGNSSFQLGMSYINYCRKWGQDMSQTEIESAFDASNRLPLCEDRNFALASIFKLRTRRLAQNALRKVIDYSASYYWLARASEGLLAMQDTQNGMRGIEKAIQAAQQTHPNYAHNPTSYQNGRKKSNSEPTPELIKNRLNLLKNHYQSMVLNEHSLEYAFFRPLSARII